jgi:tetratricopeptide (TPR) repeat protein
MKKTNIIPILLGVLIVLAAVAYFAKSKVSIKIEPDESPDLKIEESITKNKRLPEQAFQHFRKGHEFIKSKNLEGALSEFEAAAKISPESALVHFWIAKTYAYQNQAEKAIARLKKVLELEPENYHALSMIGKILATNKSKQDEAVNYLNQAIAINPSHAESRFYLARIYAVKGDTKQSLREFAILFQNEPRYAMYHYELARIFENSNAMDQARREYQRALQLNPNLSKAREALERLQ